MTAPTPEKAAPIPAFEALREHVRNVCEESADMLDAWHAERGSETSRAHWKRRALEAEKTLADREARPSLPDSREERIREDERDRLLERARNEHGITAMWLVEEGAMLPADRARARQGGNNG